ncbi:MAG TPA: twin-arginine translocase TatA/TatE family subunit [Aggregatilineales bacterium]|nr:hypothetical protein [Anaerolineales bacterium]HRE48210.1 twin-arginine translocase TatA/TatE family subunit [Aggregatilineales bacterium]
MNIFGIGAAELILILVIMFIFAGPKRMVAWAYQLGHYVAKFRQMMDETWGAIRKEFEAAEIDLPQTPPLLGSKGRFNVLAEANKVIDKELGKEARTISGELNDVAQTTRSAFVGASTVTAPAANTNTANTETPPTLAEQGDPPTPTNGDGQKYDAWLPQ